MDNIETSLPELSKLIEQRLTLLRSLAESLEFSSLALVQNDAEAIARARRIRQSFAGNGAFSKRSFAGRQAGVRRRHRPRLAHPAIPCNRIRLKPGNPRGCKPSGRRSQSGSVISRECTGRCCGTWSAVWPSWVAWLTVARPPTRPIPASSEQKSGYERENSAGE